jgi:hypothetical protein
VCVSAHVSGVIYTKYLTEQKMLQIKKYGEVKYMFHVQCSFSVNLKAFGIKEHIGNCLYISEFPYSTNTILS